MAIILQEYLLIHLREGNFQEARKELPEDEKTREEIRKDGILSL